MSKQFELDPIVQAKAVEALRESIGALGEGDDVQLLIDCVEGETTFFEAVDRILENIHEDMALVEAIKIQRDNLQARKQRFEKRVETNKALIEQAFIVANLPKIQRPLGTLYLSNRAPSVTIETESDIPAKYWKPQDPKLDGKAVADDLKAMRDGVAEILSKAGDEREEAIAAFHQRFLDSEEAQALRYQIELLDAADDGVTRDRVANAIRGVFGSVPGATLTEATRTLSLRVA